tara:strand:- start:300 stop:638 length:339 start_codon:yes stop_codon:yes gene_type:complete
MVGQIKPDLFEKYRKSAIDVLEKKPKSIYERAMMHKNTVFEFDGDFDRDKKIIEALKKVKQEDIVEALKLSIGRDTHKMINSLGFADGHQNKSNLQSGFKNIQAWKNNRVYD